MGNWIQLLPVVIFIIIPLVQAIGKYLNEQSAKRKVELARKRQSEELLRTGRSSDAQGDDSEAAERARVRAELEASRRKTLEEVTQRRKEQMEKLAKRRAEAQRSGQSKTQPQPQPSGSASRSQPIAQTAARSQPLPTRSGAPAGVPTRSQSSPRPGAEPRRSDQSAPSEQKRTSQDRSQRPQTPPAQTGLPEFKADVPAVMVPQTLSRGSYARPASRLSRMAPQAAPVAKASIMPTDVKELRKAFVLGEILAKPVALRAPNDQF